MTTNQNLQLTHVEEHEREQISWRLDDLGLSQRLKPDLQAAHMLSCVAFPTCGLAMAEAERYMSDPLDLFNRLKQQYGLRQVPITLRVTGYPNGCARPYLAEIALTAALRDSTTYTWAAVLTATDSTVCTPATSMKAFSLT
ncbi:MAG: hypothetical protein AOY29_10410 [Alcanivorax borkumensis]|jgi:sulfite reductase (NADPH) hemoprotein beta-component|uniref:Sulfite reductase (NADPH) n=2 Tax=Alcanivorax TaxID=59753 RepID=Q0VMM5_ALCBS|nr:MAG: hypothetical protein AOY29_10410 [Alcanivorax borkumensis]BAP15024.1 sulfite reductase [Alcanivorax sp. NBRC 101098]CAL17573.1 sulfite reductase (NADPH) [Alcanivorax borkumensis SK2]